MCRIPFQQKMAGWFVCPKCGCREFYHVHGKKHDRFQCRSSRHQTTLTANTMMHHSHLPLTKWFWAIYLVACDKRGISVLTLSDKIEVSYETAWYMLCRIRRAMESRDEQYYLEGIVEFDDSYFGAKLKGGTGRGADNQAVFIAVSKDIENHPLYLKMHISENVQSISVKGFMEKNVVAGSTVETDVFPSYRKPLAEKYDHVY